MQNKTWVKIAMYCPNCGKLIYGYKNDNEKIKYECNHCNVVAVRKPIGRRHNEVHIYTPAPPKACNRP